MKRFMGRFGLRSGLVVVASLVAAGGIAYAAIPDSGGVYTACRLNATGTIRLIDPSLPASNLLGHCSSLETQITWNQKGQPGAAGATGARGPQGLKGDIGPSGAQGPAGAAGATGPQGPKGDTGASGPAGADGTPGKDGATGPQGPKGDKGATGPAGPAGPAGPPGSGGSTSIVTATGSASLPTGTLQFLGKTVNVTVGAGQGALVQAQVMLGTTSTAGSATNLILFICDQQLPGGPIVVHSSTAGIEPMAAQQSINDYALTDTITGLAPGTYSVGMCGYLINPGGPNLWNARDWSYTTAQVFTP